MGDYASKGVAGAGLGTGVDRLAKVCDHLGIVATW